MADAESARLGSAEKVARKFGLFESFSYLCQRLLLIKDALVISRL